MPEILTIANAPHSARAGWGTALVISQESPHPTLLHIVMCELVPNLGHVSDLYFPINQNGSFLIVLCCYLNPHLEIMQFFVLAVGGLLTQV
jgi:hypothetical protein